MRATRTGIAADEALRSVLAEAAPLPAELVEAGAALGRVLAAPVAARRTLPPADCSAMDGYALRAADLAEAGPGRAVCLRVGGEVAAGGRAAPLAPGEAAR
ncbi:MAG: molybdopterin molybdenumtransferase MoeA, partial [Deltaproteobacteria bacterium]|nr:molybdopterin molybdenumtransferase MoeA [Deltaproteobacteria bacterium]